MSRTYSGSSDAIFSECHIAQLKPFYCLLNYPQTFETEQVCGNGWIEPGEQCDSNSSIFHHYQFHEWSWKNISVLSSLVYHHIHSVRISSIQRIFKTFICKQIWTYCTHQKSLEYVGAILKTILNLQMKNVIFQKTWNRKQHACLLQFSRVASNAMMLNS